MLSEKLITASAISVTMTLVAIFWLRPWARRVGLVDRPDARKRHRGRIPLIGGLCFFIGVVAGQLYLGVPDRIVAAALVAGALLLLAGVVDDVRNLNARARLLIESIIVLAAIAGTGLYVDSIGNLLGTADLRLFWLGIPVTLVAVVGLINAFNMLDGIDGLAGSLALVSIAGILVLAGGQWTTTGTLPMLLLLGATLVPYVLVNLGWPDGHRIFMGDAGSTLLGFLLAWSVVDLGQRGTQVAPVDLLWCIAVPVMDTLAVVTRRMRQGRSPFHADRRHLHHLLLDTGLSPRISLALIIGYAAAMAWMGYGLRNAPEGVSLVCLVVLCMAHMIWAPKAAAWLGSALLEPGQSEQPELLIRVEAATPLDASERAAEKSLVVAPLQDNRVKALCVMDGTHGDLQMVAIVQELYADQQFNPHVCIAGDGPQPFAEAVVNDALVQSLGKSRLGVPDPMQVTSAALGDMQRVFDAFAPDVVLVHGDSPAVLATALVAYCQDVPVARMVFEQPRIYQPGHAGLVGVLARVHFASSERIADELVAAGIPRKRITLASVARTEIGPAATDARREACAHVIRKLAEIQVRNETAIPPKHATPAYRRSSSSVSAVR